MARTPPEPCPGVAAAVAYALAVAGGEVPACRYVQQAAARFLSDKAAAERGEGPWAFRPELAEAAMLFAAQLPNIKGPEAGRPLRLMPWQRFVFASLFGFVERGTTTRRFRQAVVYVPRGNGKTTFAAPIALYLTFIEGEGGAEGYAAAVTRDQARILFDAAQQMVRRSPEFRTAFGVAERANAIYQEHTASRFTPVSSDAKSLDGLNVTVAVCDELASHRTALVYDVLLTAMGKRRHPLLLSISTATGNNSGIGKQMWDYAVRVLDGLQQDDRLFALIYTIDDGDDPWDEASWVKANPSWGQAVQPEAIRAIMRQARNNPAQEAAAKTRHLNVWVGADEALFSTRAWRACGDPDLTLERLEGRECHVAVDLAATTDLTALALVFPARGLDGKLHYDLLARCYLNEAAVLEARNPSYPGWAAEGWLTVTPGNETDMQAVEADLRSLAARFRVRSLAFDPWQARQMRQSLAADGLPVVEFPMRTGNLSEPTKELGAAMLAGRLRHDGNPVLEWCVGNVVGHYDARGNVYPRKARPEQKIDAAMALIMALGRAMSDAGSAAELEGFLGEPLFL
ncbi:terminase large subunit [Roseomonas sp. E05]|uniref:terminase large subunit n=1 Tax=Roseomonas sp. E05 TaxID=3046310 RepID=UPI0024BB130C|nr:terminase TerL endonuclease subunit [Roseomonas sp. E05]MDJ0391067.1 terminase large subunit [Roseomonas sp. E05]